MPSNDLYDEITPAVVAAGCHTAWCCPSGRPRRRGFPDPRTRSRLVWPRAERPRFRHRSERPTDVELLRGLVDEREAVLIPVRDDDEARPAGDTRRAAPGRESEHLLRPRVEAPDVAVREARDPDLAVRKRDASRLSADRHATRDLVRAGSMRINWSAPGSAVGPLLPRVRKKPRSGGGDQGDRRRRRRRAARGCASAR